MSSSRKFPAVALLSFLAGCGFSPLYGDNGGQPVVSQQLNQVAVANIPERTGQLLRQSLQDQLYVNGAPVAELYSLNVNYSVAEQDIGLQADTSATRDRFTASAQWTLTPVGNPQAKLTSGLATTENAANVIDQQYFALTLETNTIDQQLADTIAAQIATQLAAYFKTHPTPAGA